MTAQQVLLTKSRERLELPCAVLMQLVVFVCALPFSNPSAFSGLLSGFWCWTPTDYLAVTIQDFDFIGPLPEHQFLCPSPTGA